jgi:hypothetical protein
VESPFFYLILADAMLLLHTLIVVFIVGGLVCIYAGWLLAWSWVRNPWFRVTHATAISVVAVQSLLGIICPLTTWEMSFRYRAGDTVYSGTFISHWLETLLYYQAPAWVFMVVYTVLGALALASWYFVRPRPFGDS